jgi:hypothetical protein
MGDLPPLPSALQESDAIDPSTKAALTAPVQLNITLSSGFQAKDHISAKKNSELAAYAPRLVRDPGFDAAWLAAQALKIPLDTTLLQQVIQNTQNLDAGEVGKDTIAATHFMDEVNKRLPERPNPKFMAMYQNGTAHVQDVISTAKSVAGKIKDALSEFDSIEGPLNEVQIRLQQKFDLMFEAIALNQQLADNEDERTHQLLEYTALFEYVLVEIHKYIAELQPQAAGDAAVARKITQLNALAPLVTKTLTTFKPLIFAGHAAVDRYLNLSRMAGGPALVLGLFLSTGMARWRSDIVSPLHEMNQLAVELGQANVDESIGKQPQAASGRFGESASKYAALMKRWMTTADSMAQIADDITKAKDILVNGFAQLVDEQRQVSSAVQDATNRIDEGTRRYNSEMERIAAPG